MKVFDHIIAGAAADPRHIIFAEAFFQRRQHEGVSRQQAAERLLDPLHFTDMMVREGLAYPANDLSRGCSALDVFRLICGTGVQAQPRAAEPGR